MRLLRVPGSAFASSAALPASAAAVQFAHVSGEALRWPDGAALGVGSASGVGFSSFGALALAGFEVRIKAAIQSGNSGTSPFGNASPRDGRPRQAIDIARRFARDDATANELQAALVLARDAAEVASGQARMAAFSAFGATLRESQDAAITAARSAMWAVDGRTTPGPERIWQRAHFDQLFAHLFAS